MSFCQKIVGVCVCLTSHPVKAPLDCLLREIGIRKSLIPGVSLEGPHTSYTCPAVLSQLLSEPRVPSQGATSVTRRDSCGPQRFSSTNTCTPFAFAPGRNRCTFAAPVLSCPISFRVNLFKISGGCLWTEFEGIGLPRVLDPPYLRLASEALPPR